MYVSPRAPRDQVGGTFDGALRVRVQAPAQDGRANEAVCQVLARALGVKPRAAELQSGERSRRKCVRIAGDPASLLARAAALVRLESEKPGPQSAV